MAIPAREGVDHLVEVLDAYASRPPARRDIPIVLFRDESDRAAGDDFIRGYRERLVTDARRGLVPHALVDTSTVAPPGGALGPDIDLIDRIVEQLQHTMPAGTGRLRVPLYALCRSVLEAPVGGGDPDERRERLVDHLTARWEQRVPALKYVRDLTDGRVGDLLNRVVAAIVTVLVQAPVRWLYRLWLLRSRRLRWYTEQVAAAAGPLSSFLAAALQVSSGGSQAGNAALRHRLVLNALLHDLQRASTRPKLGIRRRRRVWPFVLLFADGQIVADTPARRLLNAHQDIAPTVAGAPIVLMVSYVGAPPMGTSSPQTPDVAATAMQSALNGSSDAERVVTIDLTDVPESRRVSETLSVNRKVRPLAVGLSAYTGWISLALVSLVVAIGGFIVIERADACPLMRTVEDKKGQAEQVGIAPVDARPGDCYFSSDRKSDLSELQRQISDQNKDALASGRYQTVVFFAPLTVPSKTEPDRVENGLWQLQGAADEQEKINDEAKNSSNVQALVLLIANPGSQFGHGVTVAKDINTLKQGGELKINAVIGISISTQYSVDALREIKDIPVFGTTVTGDEMADLGGFFQLAPRNRSIVPLMVEYAARDLGAKRAQLIFDPEDPYSKNLHDLLSVQLANRGVQTDSLVVDEIDGTSDPCRGLGGDVLPIYLARERQFRGILDIWGKCAGGRKIRVFASDAVTSLLMDKDYDLTNYRLVDVHYVTFADEKEGRANRKSGSDATAGKLAMRFASLAINAAHLRAEKQGKELTGSLVVQEVARGLEFTLSSPPGQVVAFKDGSNLATGFPVFFCQLFPGSGKSKCTWRTP